MALLEESLGRTFAADPFEQMGGYIKRCRGLTIFPKLKIRTARIDRLLVGDQPVDPQADYAVAFVTRQGVTRMLRVGTGELWMSTAAPPSSDAPSGLIWRPLFIQGRPSSAKYH